MDEQTKRSGLFQRRNVCYLLPGRCLHLESYGRCFPVTSEISATIMLRRECVCYPFEGPVALAPNRIKQK